MPGLLNSLRVPPKRGEDLRLVRFKNLIIQLASVRLLQEGATEIDIKTRLPQFLGCNVNERELLNHINQSNIALTGIALDLNQIPEGELRTFVMASANTLITHFHRYFKETNLIQRTVSNKLNVQIRHVMKTVSRFSEPLNEAPLKDYLQKYFDYLHRVQLLEEQIAIFVHAMRDPQSPNATYNTSVSILTNALTHYMRGTNPQVVNADHEHLREKVKGIKAHFQQLKEDMIIGVIGDIYHVCPQVINDGQLKAIANICFQISALNDDFNSAVEAYGTLPQEKKHLLESMALTPKSGYEILTDTVCDFEPIKKQIIVEAVPLLGGISAAHEHVTMVGGMIGAGAGYIVDGVMDCAKYLNIIAMPRVVKFFKEHYEIADINEIKFRNAVAFFNFLKTLTSDVVINTENQQTKELLFNCFFNKSEPVISYQEYCRLEELLLLDESVNVEDAVQAKQASSAVVFKALRKMSELEIGLTHSSPESVLALLRAVNEDRMHLAYLAENQDYKRFYDKIYTVKLSRLLVAAQQKILLPKIYPIVEGRDVNKESPQYTALHRLVLELQAGRLISHKEVEFVENACGGEASGFEAWIDAYYKAPHQTYSQSQLMRTVGGAPGAQMIASLQMGLDLIHPKALLEIIIAHLEQQQFSVNAIACEGLVKEAMQRKQAYCEKLASLLKKISEGIGEGEEANKALAKKLYRLPGDASETYANANVKQAFGFIKRLVGELGPLTLLSEQANLPQDLLQRVVVFLMQEIGKQDVTELMQDLSALYAYQQDMQKQHTVLNLSTVWVEAEVSDPFNMSTHGAYVVKQIVRGYVNRGVRSLKHGSGWSAIKKQLSDVPVVSTVAAYAQPVQKEVFDQIDMKGRITDKICEILGVHAAKASNEVTLPEMWVGEFYRYQALTGRVIADEKPENDLFHQVVLNIQAWVDANNIQFDINANHREAFINAVFTQLDENKQVMPYRFLLLKFHFEYLKRYADIYANAHLKSKIYVYLRDGLAQILNNDACPLTAQQKDILAVIDADCNTFEMNHQRAIEDEMKAVQNALITACQKIDGQIKQIEVPDEAGNILPTRSRYESVKKALKIGYYLGDTAWTAAGLYFVVPSIVQFVTALVHAVQITGAVIAGAAYTAFLSSPIGWAFLGLRLLVNIGVQIYRCEQALDKNGQPKKLFTKLFSPLEAGTVRGKVGEVFKKAATFAKLVLWDVLGKAILSTVFTGFIVNKVAALIRPTQMAAVKAVVAVISDPTKDQQAELNRLRRMVDCINEPGLSNETRKIRLGGLKAALEGIERARQHDPDKHCNVSEFAELIKKFGELQEAYDALEPQSDQSLLGQAPAHNSADMQRRLRRHPRKAVDLALEPAQPVTQGPALLTWDEAMKGLETAKGYVQFDSDITIMPVPEVPLTGSAVDRAVGSFIDVSGSAPTTVLFAPALAPAEAQAASAVSTATTPNLAK